MKLYNQKQTMPHASHIAKFKPNWVPAGGESHPGARPVMQEWVRDIRDQCLRAKFRFSSSNGVGCTCASRILPGRCATLAQAEEESRANAGRLHTEDEMPVNLVRA